MCSMGSDRLDPAASGDLLGRLGAAVVASDEEAIDCVRSFCLFLLSSLGTKGPPARLHGTPCRLQLEHGASSLHLTCRLLHCAQPLRLFLCPTRGALLKNSYISHEGLVGLTCVTKELIDSADNISSHRPGLSRCRLANTSSQPQNSSRTRHGHETKNKNIQKCLLQLCAILLLSCLLVMSTSRDLCGGCCRL